MLFIVVGVWFEAKIIMNYELALCLYLALLEMNMQHPLIHY